MPLGAGWRYRLPVGVTNERLLAWVRQMRRLCKPDSVHWVDGLVEEYGRLCAQMVECGTFTRLNPEKHPNSVIAGTATERSPNVVAWIR